MTSLSFTKDNLYNFPENCFINKLSTYSQSKCSAAFSLRLLKNNYTGPMVNVRRSSDNASLDFYGDVNGTLGTIIHGKGQSLNNWLNGSTGFLTKWYDQSGNSGRDLIQVTLSQQPIINPSTKTITYDGGDILYNTTNTPLTTGLDTYTYVCNFTYTSNSNGTICDIAPNPYTNYSRAGLLQVTGGYGFVGQFADAFIINNNTSTNRKCVMMCNHNLSSGNIIINDNATTYIATTSIAPSNLSVNPTAFTVGRGTDGSNFFIGDINEVIIFQNTLTIRESELYFIPNIITRKNYSNFPKIQLKGVPKDGSPIPSGWRFGFDSQSFSNLTSGNSITSAWSLYQSDSNFTVSTTITPFNNPIYRNISGTSTNALTQAPYIEFTRASSMYLNCGSRTLNITTNGGFTAVAYCAFTDTAATFERIFDFGNGTSDNILFCRNSTSSNLQFDIYNAGSSVCSIVTTNNCIIQNEWAVYTCRYTYSNNLVEILKNGILQISGTGSSVTNKTLSNTYVGRSNFSGFGDAFASINISGIYMYDRYLTDTQLSSISNHLVYSSTRDIPNIIPDYTKIFKVGNVQTIGYRQDQAMFFNGNINSYIDIQDVPALPLTYCYWFKADNTTNYKLVGLCDFNRGTNFGIQNDISFDNFVVYAALPTTWTSSTPYAVTADTWYHITIVVNLSFQVLVYINGSLYQTLTGTAIPPARSRFIVGADGANTLGYRGMIYDFRVYDYTLRANEITDIYESRVKLQLTYTSPSNYLVNVRNWYNTMTLYTSGTFTATTTVSDPNVQYQLLNGTLNNYNTFYNQTPIQNYTSFTCSFEFYTSSATADELFFFCGANTTVLNGTNGKGQLNSYGINLQVFSTPGIYLYNNSSIPVSYSGVTNWKNLAMWVPIIITYTRGSINTWVINISGSDIITYSDPNNSNWLTTAGNYWGIGARCGGSSMNAYIRRVELTYTPYTYGLVNTLNSSLKTFPTGAMTANTTVLTDGTYTASASNTAFGSPFNVFNNTFKTQNTTWYAGRLYNITTGIYTGSVTTTVSGTSQLGEWIQIQLPKAIVINSYGLTTYWTDNNYKPRSFILAGSNDATTWVSLSDIPSKTNWVYGNEEVFNVETSLDYTYYRIIFRRAGISDAGSGQDYVIIDSFRLFSTQNTNKLPIAALTSNNTNIPGNTLNNGNYICRSSTVGFSSPPYFSFQNNTNGPFWHNIPNYNTSGIYTGSFSTVSSSISYSGEWIDIQLPNPIQLVSFNIFPRQDSSFFLIRSPRRFVMAGSNDGINWTSLHIDSGILWSNLEQTFICNQLNSNKYNYFRLIVQETGNGDGYININISLFASISIGSSITSRGLIDGLTWKSYNGYHSDSMTFTQTNTYNNIGRSIDFTSLRTETTGQFFNGLGQDLFTIEWFGYFRANATGIWTFTISSDDNGYVWIGSTALNGYTTTNPIAKNSAPSGTINMISGVYYPIRILYGENLSLEEFSMTFTPPGGVPTYNGNGYLFSSTGLNSAYPAESAKIIKDLTGINTDGTYYINVNGLSTATYCLMNDMYDGGGWMMLMKATTGTTFQYTANYWSTTNTLNPSDTTRNNADAKYDVFNYNSIKDVMAIWPDINPDNYANIYGKNGGCFYVNDGWVWKVDNWNGNARTTALAGFQNTRFPAGGTGSTTQPIGINNPFQYSGFSNTLFSYQTGAYLHYFNADVNFLYKTRWGFVWNNETTDFFTSDAIAGIGLLAGGNNYSAGDYYSAAGVSNLNRQARVEMYGR